MNNEKPIIFSGEMVRAILGGRKTMTRRVVKLPKTNQPPRVFDHLDQFGTAVFTDGLCVYGYGAVGDRFWVRETWWQHIHDYSEKTQNHPIHFFDDKPDESAGWVKQSPLFLPRNLARITLEIIDVRVERLQDISGADAIAEGMPMNLPIGHGDSKACAVTEFEMLWNKINGKKYPWSSNPWVWVIEFKVSK